MGASPWEELPNEMTTRRGCKPGVVRHGSKIFVVGGYDAVARRHFKSVEVYDIAAGKWSTMPTEMHFTRDSFGVVMHGDNMYAIGGMGEEHVDEGECRFGK